MSHGHDVRISNQGSGERGTSAAGSGEGRMRIGERLERGAVTGEWEVENEWGGQRCPENGKREKLERRGEPCGIVSSMLFLSFVLNFYFLKKTTTATFPVLSSSDYQYDEYHQYH